ncbi:MAG: hypothetical protein V1792_21665 [Pseudomonadota bacterium]
MNRGRRRESIFLGDEDYLGFMPVLEEGSVMWNVGIAALRLTPNTILFCCRLLMGIIQEGGPWGLQDRTVIERRNAIRFDSIAWGVTSSAPL